jgi:hypothetical protein
MTPEYLNKTVRELIEQVSSTPAREPGDVDAIAALERLLSALARDGSCNGVVLAWGRRLHRGTPKGE